MKIGLISDIHADLPALQKALDLLRAEGVDQILCAGDLVEKGKYGNQVVHLIQDLQIPCVPGNHDAMAPVNQRWIRKNMDLDHPQVQSILLSDETLASLKILPQHLRFGYEGKRILLVHGTLKSNQEYLWDKSPSATIHDHAQQADADIVIYGHTHSPTYLSAGKVRFINPGSITNDDTRSSYTCAMLTLPECHVDVFPLEYGIKLPQRAKIIP